MTFECVRCYSFHHDPDGHIIDRDPDELEALSKIYAEHGGARVLQMTDRAVANLPSSARTQDDLVREAKVLAHEKGWPFDRAVYYIMSNPNPSATVRAFKVDQQEAVHTYAQDDLSDVNRAGEILLRLVREYRIEHSGLGFEEALHEVMSRPANQHLVKVYNAVAE